MMMSRSKAFSYGPRILTGSPLLSAVAGFPYVAALTGTGGAQPYSYAQVSGVLASGLTLSPSGVISGIPLSAQVDNVGVQITDAAGAQSAVVILSLTVTATLAITTASPLPDGLQESSYPFTFAATGGVSPYAWSVIAGSLPSALSLSSSGVLSGVTPNPGTSLFTVQAQDQLGVLTSKPFSLTIDPVFVATPTALPPAGTYAGPLSVALDTATPSGVIWYTLDGSIPTFPPTGTTVSYSGPITVGASQTIKALASSSGFTNSPVATAAYVINAAPGVVTPLIKFMPGDSMSASSNGGTVNYVDGANTYAISADLNSALATCFRANHTNVRAVNAWFKAPALEPTQGNYTFDGSATDPILNAYKAVQAEYRRGLGLSVGDFGGFGVMISNGVNTSASNNTPALIAGFTFNGSAGPAAPWIRDCVINGHTETYNGHTVGYIDVFNTVGATVQSNGPTIWTPSGPTTRYPLAIQPGASQQCGYGYAGWNSVAANTFATCYPTTWEIGHGKARQNFWKALSLYKLPYTNASGVTTWLTWSDHPLIGIAWWGDETSPGYQVGTKPVSSDAINYPNGNFLSATGYWAEVFDWLSQVSANFPKLQIGGSWNFLFQTGGADDDTHSSYSTRFAQIGANGWNNIVLKGPDTYSNAFGATWAATDAQQNVIGVVPSASTPGTINPALSLQGKMGIHAQVQQPDWSNHVAGGSGNNFSITCGQGIITAANGHSNTPGQIALCASNRDWYFDSLQSLTSDWPTFIYPSFSGVFGQTTTPVYTQRATRLMAGMLINSVAVASLSSLTVSCTLPILDAAETGLTFPVYRNGVQVGVLNGSGTFTDTGLLTATLYTYTVGMANANGSGTQGPAVVFVIPGAGPTPLAPSTLPPAGINVPYPFSFSSFGPGTVTNWFLYGLPWATIDSSGNLTGTPTVAGTYVFQVFPVTSTGVAGAGTFTCIVS